MRSGGTICALATVIFSSPLLAGGLKPLSYAQLENELSGRITFDDLPVLPEPGASYDMILTAPSVRIGERLEGQTRQMLTGFDEITGTPRLPLNVVEGGTRKNLAVAYHAGFGSNALFPLGPDGFDQISGRGEGALALVFDHEITRFALKLHADYADPLGSRPIPGPVTLTFYDATGKQIATQTLRPDTGVASYGFHLPAPIRAVTITHTDPGGIAVDDILYPLETHTS